MSSQLKLKKARSINPNRRPLRTSALSQRDLRQHTSTPKKTDSSETEKNHRDHQKTDAPKRTFNRDHQKTDAPKRYSKDKTSLHHSKNETKGVSKNPRTLSSSDKDLVRISKKMSTLGMCSRREADEWLQLGWVMVDGKVKKVGDKMHPQQLITLKPEAKKAQTQQITIILNKPIGYVSGQAEKEYLPAISLIQKKNHWENDPYALRFSAQHLRGLAPAGRLDIDSTGLLVLTQDGRIAKQLIGENSNIDKEYLVRVQYGEVTQNIQDIFPATELAKLRHGLSLDDKLLKPAQVSWQNGEQLRFILREGKKRQIRRMCELVGLHVVGLKRIRVGKVTLGDLPMGQWRYLSTNEQF